MPPASFASSPAFAHRASISPNPEFRSTIKHADERTRIAPLRVRLFVTPQRSRGVPECVDRELAILRKRAVRGLRLGGERAPELHVVFGYEVEEWSRSRRDERFH